MTLELYAQPYDISACGFYFSDAEDFAAKASAVRKDDGLPVEEFEIQFIDGDDIDCALAKAWGLNQANFAAFLVAANDWNDDQKQRFIIAVGECGYDFDPANCEPNDFEVDIYVAQSLPDLAAKFVEEGYYGPIPEQLTFYIDHDAIARDLSVDFAMIEIAGRRFAYACR